MAQFVDPDLLKAIVTELLKVVLLLIAGLTTYILKMLSDKLRVNITERQQERITEMATKAVFYAEEMAAKQVAAGYPGDTGKLKLAYAWQYLQREAVAMAPAVASRAIHEVLGKTQGLGASKEVGQAEPVLTIPGVTTSGP